MPIIDTQRRLREAGRIRLGEKVATNNGKTRPGKLSAFRFTSSDEKSIRAIAAIYGGEVKKWDDAPVGDQWEVYSDTTSLDVIVPPVDLAFSQWMELWSGGGCTRRCDGQTNVLTNTACVCDPDNPECKPTTRLGVIIMALEGIGVWRLETHGWNGAQELLGSIEVFRSVQNRGGMVPARLLLDQRQSRRDGKTYNFAVPVLDINVSVAALTNGASVGAQLPRGNVTPIERTGEVPSVAEQLAAVDDPDRLRGSTRANAAQPLRSTGLAPRPATQLLDGEEPFGPDDVTSPSEQEKPEAPQKAQGATKKAAAPPATHTPGGASTRSVKRLNAILSGKGIKDGGRHTWAAEHLGKPVASFNDLTQDEVTKLNDIAEGAVAPVASEVQYADDDPERPFE